MKIKQSAVAGTLESSDALVTVELHEGSVELDISSSVINQYGRQIRATVVETLKRLDVDEARVTVRSRRAWNVRYSAPVDRAKKTFHGEGLSDEREISSASDNDVR